MTFSLLEFEYPFVLAIAAFALLVFGGLCLGYAVGTDASVRGQNGWEWGVYSFFFAPLAVPVYLVVRARRYPPRAEPPAQLERITGSIGGGTFVSLFVAVWITPPDPFALVSVFPVLTIVAIPLAYVALYEPGLGRVFEIARTR